MKKLLEQIYGSANLEANYQRLLEVIEGFEQRKFDKPTSKTTYMITYGDSFYNDENGPTLNCLNQVTSKLFKDNITDIHILPMFPYTSDDGFSVVDFYSIDKNLGDWSNIDELAKNYRLMFDFVANHVSQESEWFKKCLAGDSYYSQFFVEHTETFDYSNVVRPRALPLFHEYKNGKKYWTTFSEDQLDLNFANYELFLETVKILLTYIEKGATSIRLDAIGFIWKENGTSCIHLEKAHLIIKLWRQIVDKYASNVQLITETNVPHLENISYFGNGDEANMVYQFALPPLVLYSFINGSSTKLSDWAKTISVENENTTFFNFLSSHDGIGLRPLENILNMDEIKTITDRVEENGGLFNYKNNTDGTKSIYEMNCTYYDAISINGNDIESFNRFLAAHFILLSVVGVPAIYYNSLLGFKNYYKGVEKSGINRRINREKHNISDILELENSQIVQTFNKLLSIRGQNADFDPYVPQEVIEISESIFAIKRNNTICLVNLCNEEIKINEFTDKTNIIDGNKFEGVIKPYGYLWLK